MSSTKIKAATEMAGAAVDQTMSRGSEAVAQATDKVTEMTTKGFDSTLASMKESMGKASKGMETSQVKMKEGVEKAMKTAEEMISFSQGNIEAIMKSSQIYASGFQDIAKRFAASNKAALEESVSFTKSLLGVKSVKEAVDLQSDFARSSIEKLVAETNQMTDASVRLAEEAIQPLTVRMSMAVQTFGKGS